MNRQNVKHSFLVSELAPLCDKHAKHHRDRETFYREKYDVAEKELRDKGLVMMEQAAILCSGSITGYGVGGRSLTPQLDQKYVEAVNKAKEKVNEHKSKAEEYEKYGRAYRAISARCLFFAVDLHADDIEFFRIDEI